MNSKVKMISEMKKTSFIAMPDPSLHSLSCACLYISLSCVNWVRVVIPTQCSIFHTQHKTTLRNISAFRKLLWGCLLTF